ncbi:nucleotidyltransferase domain-containing protein [Desulfonatronum parangueonense]
MAAVIPEIVDVVQNFVEQVKKERRVAKAYLFGSYAKGTAEKWSDIDLAIISPDFSNNLFEERVLLMKLALQFDDRIEPSPFRPEDFNRENPLVNEIQNTGIEIS